MDFLTWIMSLLSGGAEPPQAPPPQTKQEKDAERRAELEERLRRAQYRGGTSNPYNESPPR